jgi:hypothetical protein
MLWVDDFCVMLGGLRNDSLNTGCIKTYWTVRKCPLNRKKFAAKIILKSKFLKSGGSFNSVFLFQGRQVVGGIHCAWWITTNMLLLVVKVEIIKWSRTQSIYFMVVRSNTSLLYNITSPCISVLYTQCLLLSEIVLLFSANWARRGQVGSSLWNFWFELVRVVKFLVRVYQSDPKWMFWFRNPNDSDRIGFGSVSDRICTPPVVM